MFAILVIAVLICMINDIISFEIEEIKEAKKRMIKYRRAVKRLGPDYDNGMW